jgi:hypothetical protein
MARAATPRQGDNEPPCQLGCWGQNAAVVNRLPTRWRNVGRETAGKRQRVHVDGVGAITVGLEQLDADPAIGQEVQVLLT